MKKRCGSCQAPSYYGRSDHDQCHRDPKSMYHHSDGGCHFGACPGAECECECWTPLTRDEVMYLRDMIDAYRLKEREELS